MHFHGTEVRKPIPSYQIYKGTVFELVDQAVDFAMSKIARRVGTRAESTQVPVDYELPRELIGRSMIVRKAQRLDVECIVRGYITGSAWSEYQKWGTVNGVRLEKGIVESQQLPETKSARQTGSGLSMNARTRSAPAWCSASRPRRKHPRICASASPCRTASRTATRGGRGRPIPAARRSAPTESGRESSKRRARTRRWPLCRCRRCGSRAARSPIPEGTLGGRGHGRWRPPGRAPMPASARHDLARGAAARSARTRIGVPRRARARRRATSGPAPRAGSAPHRSAAPPPGLHRPRSGREFRTAPAGSSARAQSSRCLA